MTDGYFENSLDLHNAIMKRKFIVREQLARLGKCMHCDEVPDAPCCLLQTELDILQRLSDTLDRELWHMRGQNEA